jgi:hypothetical protein
LPSVEETAGEVEFAGRQWHWVTKVSQTQVQGMRRIDVSVRRDGDPEDSSLVTLAGFVGATATASPPTIPDWYNMNWPGRDGWRGRDRRQDNADETEEPEPVE